MRTSIRSLATMLAAASAACGAAARADTFAISYEAPGVQNTTATFSVVGVETFDTRVDAQGFTTDYGTGGAISATYSKLRIMPADQYGGAGGVGQYAVTYGPQYSIKLTADPTVLPNGINYFGYWLSALDKGNLVSFYRAGVGVGALTPTDVSAYTSGNPAYYGNPNAPFLGRNRTEPYVFVNFFDTDGSFDEIRFRESPPGAGYESDNHTVGYYTSMGAVPEPATWAMMIVGIGLVGATLRARRGAPDRRVASV